MPLCVLGRVRQGTKGSKGRRSQGCSTLASCFTRRPTPVAAPALAPRRHAPGELHPALQLCAAVLPGDASPVQLHCQALRVPMQALLRPLSSPPPLGPSASVSEFFRTWSTLPARATLPGKRCDGHDGYGD